MRLSHWFTMVSLVALSGCSSNPIKESWTEPKQALPLEFDKTLVVAVMDTPANRRVAEDELVRLLPSIQGEASYPLVDDSQLAQLKGSRDKVLEQGFTKAFLLRLVSQSTEVVEQPSVGIGFGRGFWGGSYSSVSVQSNSLESRDIVTYELSLYSLDNDKLLWTGTGELMNPGRISSSMSTLSEGVIQQWQEQGVLPATGAAP